MVPVYWDSLFSSTLDNVVLYKINYVGGLQVDEGL